MVQPIFFRIRRNPHLVTKWTDENNCMPKAVVGDEAFFQEDQRMSLWFKNPMAKQG